MTAVTAEVVTAPSIPTEKNVVFAWGLNATRQAKRAVAYGGKTVWEGVKITGRGIYDCLPYIGVLLAVSLAVALVYFSAYLAMMFIQFVFTISPILGYLLIAITAVQLLTYLVGGIFGLSRMIRMVRS